MKEIFNWLNESFFTRPLSPGCTMCAKGAKMVVLITGLCPAKCYYCPLSYKKRGNDDIYADEWKLKDENDTETLIQEGKYIEATGAGITGGDPLYVWERTKNFIKILKQTFGPSFHIHLYTPGLKNTEHIQELVASGLDEIRFHPMFKDWSDMDNSKTGKAILNSFSLDVDVALEIPSIPKKEEAIFSMIKWADQIGVRWVNLNELEFSETNATNLKQRGLEVKSEISAAVKNSYNTAKKVIEKATIQELDIGVHYCSSSFKDGIQLRNRIKRRAKNVVKDYEVITKDGTLIFGIVTCLNLSADNIFHYLKENFHIDQSLIFYNEEKNRVETGVWILEEISHELNDNGFRCYMVEEYPTADRLEVERTPLPF